jgi:hypothetical protein
MVNSSRLFAHDVHQVCAAASDQCVDRSAVDLTDLRRSGSLNDQLSNSVASGSTMNEAQVIIQ